MNDEVQRSDWSKQRERRRWNETRPEYLIADRYAGAATWAAFWIGLGLALGLGGPDLLRYLLGG